MGISNIPNPSFVFCVNCSFRTKQKSFNKNGWGRTIRYFCGLVSPPRKLFGQKGCDKGKRRMDRND